MKIIFTRPAGDPDGEGVSVCIPARQQDVVRSFLSVNPELAERIKNMTPIEFVQWIVRRDVPLGATDVKIVADSELPTDRHFRAAWKIEKGNLGVHMPKAREIQKEHLRRARKPLLDALDVEYIRADESRNNTRKNEIKAEKQRLRDITQDPRIEAAQTPKQLKEVTV